MIEWFDQSQGFLITILTLIYVVTTIFILNSNRKSAAAAARSNKQQLALQLLDRRLHVYYLLSNWMSIANSLFVENFPLGTPIDLFSSLLYSNTNDTEIEGLNKQIIELQQKLTSPNFSQSIQGSTRSKLDEVFQARFMKRFQTLGKEKEVIGQIEVLFPYIDYSPIKSFCDALFASFVNTNEDSIGKLKAQCFALKQLGYLDRLWKSLKEI